LKETVATSSVFHLRERKRTVPDRLAHRVAVALGANLGNPVLTLGRAAGRLAAEGVRELRVSDLFRTQPLDCVPGTPAFVNAVLVGTWHGCARSLLRTCQSLETEFGRPREHSQHAARALDLDIVLVGRERLSWPELVVPHPRMERRLFVLVPLAQLAGDWFVPGAGLTVRQLCDRELARQGAAWGRRIGPPPGHFA
jgi:2-amino-4-hydroxy-6-hydroxymethyldihydropteridine diphosphokinase